MLAIYLKRTLLAIVGIVTLLCIVLVALWNHRSDIAEIGWATPTEAVAEAGDAVTVTWLGVSTLLFDDGETQILIDGFFTRPSLADMLLRRPVQSSAAQVNFVMNEYRMRRLAAIIPVHSHFDHVLDISAIARRSSASILGSVTTSNIARGAGVPEDQIAIVVDESPYQFGEFKVTLKPSRHAPIGWRGSVPIDGTVDEPLIEPQPISSYRMGGAYSIVIEHPQGTALVHGSAGFNKYDLRAVAADVVMLGVSQLDSLGREYTNVYWQNVVTATGAHSVYPIHFDDFTQPWGVVELPPKFIDDFAKTSKWIEELRDRWDRDTSLFLPEFGKPVAIFAQPPATP